MVLNHNVWIPKLKFTLQTISVTYPQNPNDVEKKKYYDFVQNLPLFFPFKPFGKNFIELLDQYPVTPYLSSRMSFMKWVHFIFNKINVQMELPEEDFDEYLNKYYDDYKPEEMKKKNIYKTRRKYIKFAFGVLLLSGCIYFYNKEN